MYSESIPQKPVTNRQSWSEVIEIIDEETRDPSDISDVDEITFALARTGCSPFLTLTIGNGITLIDSGTTGKFQIDITVDQMRSLCAPETYAAGITMLLVGETVQIFDGTFPVIQGVTN